MKWVKIEDGCEMPGYGEVVVICDDEGEWVQACYRERQFHPIDEDGYVTMWRSCEGATHWARVELPEE